MECEPLPSVLLVAQPQSPSNSYNYISMCLRFRRDARNLSLPFSLLRVKNRSIRLSARGPFSGVRVKFLALLADLEKRQGWKYCGSPGCFTSAILQCGPENETRVLCPGGTTFCSIFFSVALYTGETGQLLRWLTRSSSYFISTASDSMGRHGKLGLVNV